MANAYSCHRDRSLSLNVVGRWRVLRLRFWPFRGLEGGHRAPPLWHLKIFWNASHAPVTWGNTPADVRAHLPPLGVHGRSVPASKSGAG